MCERCLDGKYRNAHAGRAHLRFPVAQAEPQSSSMAFAHLARLAQVDLCFRRCSVRTQEEPKRRKECSGIGSRAYKAELPARLHYD